MGMVQKKNHMQQKSTLNLQKLNIFKYIPDNCWWPKYLLRVEYHIEQTAVEKEIHSWIPVGTHTHRTEPLAEKLHSKVNCHFCLCHNTSNPQS